MSSDSTTPRHTERFSPRLRRLGIPATVLFLLLSLWSAGLVWFVGTLPATVADPDSDTDAIVVLTGGSLRVQSGLSLLAAGKAKKLFVSGVYHSTDVTALLHASRQAPDWLSCCIVLGHEADNTLGNALETAAWMRQEGFHSLRLVTSNYHMPRSVLEFSRAMPEIRLVPHPVFPDLLRQDRWWGGGMVIIGEYQKYLLALVRPRFMGGEARLGRTAE